APPERTRAFVNFCLPIEPSIGSTAARRYALKAHPKSEIATPVKRRSMPLMTRDGTERPTEALRARRRPVATSLRAATASSCECCDRPAVELVDRGGLVEDGHDDREIGRREIGLRHARCLDHFGASHRTEDSAPRSLLRGTRDRRPGTKLTMVCLRRQSIGVCS